MMRQWSRFIARTFQWVTCLHSSHGTLLLFACMNSIEYACGSWVDAREEYSVQWAEYYEPYIVGAKSVMPEYDERFTGYGP